MSRNKTSSANSCTECIINPTFSNRSPLCKECSDRLTKKLIALHENDWTRNELAAKFDLTPTAVDQRIYRYRKQNEIS